MESHDYTRIRYHMLPIWLTAMKNRNLMRLLRCACEIVPELFAVAGETVDESKELAFDSDVSRTVSRSERS